MTVKLPKVKAFPLQVLLCMCKHMDTGLTHVSVERLALDLDVTSGEISKVLDGLWKNGCAVTVQNCGWALTYLGEQVIHAAENPTLA